ncbi:hypothetical protein DIPPA_15822 [Diplonema papillatum]|nr:hypothetical protein DIPPA_15822 [Diplonema papillatum]
MGESSSSRLAPGTALGAETKPRSGARSTLRPAQCKGEPSQADATPVPPVPNTASGTAEGNPASPRLAPPDGRSGTRDGSAPPGPQVAGEGEGGRGGDAAASLASEAGNGRLNGKPPCEDLPMPRASDAHASDRLTAGRLSCEDPPEPQAIDTLTSSLPLAAAGEGAAAPPLPLPSREASPPRGTEELPSPVAHDEAPSEHPPRSAGAKSGNGARAAGGGGGSRETEDSRAEGARTRGHRRGVPAGQNRIARSACDSAAEGNGGGLDARASAVAVCEDGEEQQTASASGLEEGSPRQRGESRKEPHARAVSEPTRNRARTRKERGSGNSASRLEADRLRRAAEKPSSSSGGVSHQTGRESRATASSVSDADCHQAQRAKEVSPCSDLMSSISLPHEHVCKEGGGEQAGSSSEAHYQRVRSKEVSPCSDLVSSISLPHEHVCKEGGGEQAGSFSEAHYQRVRSKEVSPCSDLASALSMPHERARKEDGGENAGSLSGSETRRRPSKEASPCSDLVSSLSMPYEKPLENKGSVDFRWRSKDLLSPGSDMFSTQSMPDERGKPRGSPVADDTETESLCSDDRSTSQEDLSLLMAVTPLIISETNNPFEDRTPRTTSTIPQHKSQTPSTLFPSSPNNAASPPARRDPAKRRNRARKRPPPPAANGFVFNHPRSPAEEGGADGVLFNRTPTAPLQKESRLSGAPRAVPSWLLRQQPAEDPPAAGFRTHRAAAGGEPAAKRSSSDSRGHRAPAYVPAGLGGRGVSWDEGLGDSMLQSVRFAADDRPAPDEAHRAAAQQPVLTLREWVAEQWMEKTGRAKRLLAGSTAAAAARRSSSDPPRKESARDARGAPMRATASSPLQSAAQARPNSLLPLLGWGAPHHSLHDTSTQTSPVFEQPAPTRVYDTFGTPPWSRSSQWRSFEAVLHKRGLGTPSPPKRAAAGFAGGEEDDLFLAGSVRRSAEPPERVQSADTHLSVSATVSPASSRPAAEGGRQIAARQRASAFRKPAAHSPDASSDGGYPSSPALSPVYYSSGRRRRTPLKKPPKPQALHNHHPHSPGLPSSPCVDAGSPVWSQGGGYARALSPFDEPGSSFSFRRISPGSYAAGSEKNGKHRQSSNRSLELGGEEYFGWDRQDRADAWGGVLQNEEEAALRWNPLGQTAVSRLGGVPAPCVSPVTGPTALSATGTYSLSRSFSKSPLRMRSERVRDGIVLLARRLNDNLLRKPHFACWRVWASRQKSARRVPKQQLLRLLLDSRQVSTNDRSTICWIPNDSRQSFLFLLYPSPQKRDYMTTTPLGRWLRHIASFLLLTGPDVYDLPITEQSGVLLYEIPFSKITGMDYSNNLTSDGRLAIEVQEVLKWWFPSDIVLYDFVSDRVLPVVVVVLAAAVACSTRQRGEYDFLLLLKSPRGAPAAAALDASVASIPSLSSTQTVYEPGTADRPVSRFPWLDLAVTATKQSVPIPAPPSTIQTNMVVFYFGDDTAPQLPSLLWNILKRDENSKQLKIVESGLPSWAVFLPQRNIYYRKWLRNVVQTIGVVWPIITLIAALIDLYRSFETIRFLCNYIGGLFVVGQEYLFYALAMIYAYTFEPLIEGVWAILSDWWRMMALRVLQMMEAQASFWFGVLHAGWEFCTSIPLFSALAETKAYFVSMLLPYFADLFSAVSSACRLWMQVISNAWSVTCGSMLAVGRMVSSFAKMPKWLAESVRFTFSGIRLVFSVLGRFVAAMLSSLPSLLPKIKDTVNTTNETTVRWTIARNTISGVVSRTWNLTLFVGNEISKHWLTMVHRPFQYLLHCVHRYGRVTLSSVAALLPFGLISHLFLHDFAKHSTAVEVSLDVLLYLLCFFLVYNLFPVFDSIQYIIGLKRVQKVLFGAVVAAIAVEEVLSLPDGTSAKMQCFVVASILVLSAAIWKVGSAVFTLVRSRYPRRAAQPPSGASVLGSEAAPVRPSIAAGRKLSLCSNASFGPMLTSHNSFQVTFNDLPLLSDADDTPTGPPPPKRHFSSVLRPRRDSWHGPASSQRGSESAYTSAAKAGGAVSYASYSGSGFGSPALTHRFSGKKRSYDALDDYSRLSPLPSQTQEARWTV